MLKLRRFLSTILSLGMLLLITGCSKMEVLNPMGPIAEDEKQLLIDALCLMLIIIIPVIILTLLIARRYRASNTKAKYSPNWSHGTLLEAGWWVLPIIIIAVLGTMTWRTTHSLDPYKPINSKVPALNIQVVSLQWRWLFIYPAQNIATLDFVEFPVDTPINFSVTSDAPMNSFQIRQLAGQIYAMNGMKTELHLIASHTGDYAGRSVNFSGPGFADMTFVAHVVSENDFNTWVQTVKKGNSILTLPAYKQLALPSQDHSVQLYSNVAPDLFNHIIMSYMGPDMPNMKMTSGS
ncbi:MAG: ubiquinol oxidase subunit II [Gammaproteobacteria bacterium]|nr:ubiquinol oxidase subunit II [Gammaproteobacteria bacterium]